MNPYSFAPVVLCVAASSALATNPLCNQHTTEGSWMYTCEGTLPAPAQTSTRILGSCKSSRSGFFSCHGTVNLGGQIISQGLEGQANTLPNCTGTISYDQMLGGAYAGKLDIQYVIYGDGNSISGLPVNSGGVLSCSLKRIEKD